MPLRWLLGTPAQDHQQDDGAAPGRTRTTHRARAPSHGPFRRSTMTATIPPGIGGPHEWPSTPAHQPPTGPPAGPPVDAAAWTAAPTPTPPTLADVGGGGGRDGRPPTGRRRPTAPPALTGGIVG